MDIVSKDVISSLPEALICYILSFLPTKEAALTSLLSKKWRYLFAFSPNLDFDDSEIYARPEMGSRNRDDGYKMFMDFVDRVLSLHGNSTINKFSLKCQDGVYPGCVSRWITNVMERGVSDLDLNFTVNRDDSVSVNWDDSVSIPASVFVSKSLVRLRIETVNGVLIYVEDVFLPKVKTLHLDAVVFGDHVKCSLDKLVSGCPVLEELVLIEVCLNNYWNRSLSSKTVILSSKTLKKLTLRCEDWNKNPDSVLFDTPNIVYFEYFYPVVDKYGILNFDSLVEASIGLRMTCDQLMNSSYGDLIGTATDLLMRISNVQTLYLSANTLAVLTFCCEQIPVFKNLIHLTIQTQQDREWDSIPALLKNCPKLETLVFEGLHLKNTFKCEDIDGCLCRSSEDLPSFLSSSPVKVIKILKFDELWFYSDKTAKQWQIEQVKYFLEVMPNLEQMIVCYNTRIDEDLKRQLERLVASGASSKCNVQLICDYVI